MINHQRLELSIPQTNFSAPKDVRATEVRLYISYGKKKKKKKKKNSLKYP